MDTRKDQSMACALYNAAGDVLATDTQYGDNLATSVLIRYEKDDFVSARCVDN